MFRNITMSGNYCRFFSTFNSVNPKGVCICETMAAVQHFIFTTYIVDLSIPLLHKSEIKPQVIFFGCADWLVSDRVGNP